MPIQFNLHITTDPANGVADVYLQDEHGAQLAFHQANIIATNPNLRRGMFDLYEYLHWYVDEDKHAITFAEIGVAISELLLGKEISARLWEGTHRRTLRIHLPAVTQTEDNLVAALARVPWEIARPTEQEPTLGNKNLLVRVSHSIASPPSQPVPLAPDEALRVLFIFAEAKGSRPLSARKERRELKRLFMREVYPTRRVVAHFLTHGVTRERLVDQIQQHNGYHIVHWSGHGKQNVLDIASTGCANGAISGDELVTLFSEAGGFLPRLVFLSACQSGDSLQARNWSDFFSIVKKHARPRECLLDDSAGAQPQLSVVAGTAYALLNSGVPSVVAMRYAVSDDYARELAIKFYAALLADPAPKDAADALNRARRYLATRSSDEVDFSVSDHATAMLYGSEQPGLGLPNGQSPELYLKDPRLHKIEELSTVSHEHFVGRTWELADLGSNFIGSRSGAEITPAAVITGLGGMGKTALTAEALELWADRFDWVLLYQAKPSPLVFETTLRDIHYKLNGELGTYHQHVTRHPADRIFREAEAEFSGTKRTDRLINNLLRALQHESILLVLDNFEANLKPQAESVQGQLLWACQDPAWDNCLKALAIGLASSRSRLLVTSRMPLRALPGKVAFAVLLGPLPPYEAALYLRTHPALSRMAMGSDSEKRSLALRVLNASRFHPLLMDRLARLAADEQLHKQLLLAVETLENTSDYAGLPELFTSTAHNADERTYLADALALSLDQLIKHMSADECRLLWVVSLANDPVATVVLSRVWNFLCQNGPSPDTLLRSLLNLGLVKETKVQEDDLITHLSCHELVRERVQKWMDQHPENGEDLSPGRVREIYARWFSSYFMAMQHEDMDSALLAGRRALVYSVQAQAWDQMESFVSSLVTSTQSSRLVEALIPHLQIAVASVSDDQIRLSFLCSLADALVAVNQIGAASTNYEQAAELAHSIIGNSEDDARRAWGSLATIYCNWAIIHTSEGHFEKARRCYLKSNEAEEKAGAPTINTTINELQILRLDIKQGDIKEVEADVTALLEMVCGWWSRYQAGEVVPEAPDAEVLARALIGAFNLAIQVDDVNEDWEASLAKVEIVLDIERSLARPSEGIGATRFNRANTLMQMPERLDEARDELEACIELFQHEPNVRAKILTSLANLAEKQGDLNTSIDYERRALALHEQLPDPFGCLDSHNNLACCLSMRATALDRQEQPHHRLASLIYSLETDSRQTVTEFMGNCFMDIKVARSLGIPFVLPSVVDLVNMPDFSTLAHWLEQREAVLEDIQVAIDKLLDQVRLFADRQNSPIEPNQDA